MPMLTTLLLAAALQRAGAPPAFDFHSDLWINLHHFLYHVAQPPGPPPRSPVPPPTGVLSPAEKLVWDDATAYYRQHVIQHDLLFDDDMTRIKGKLAQAEGDTVLPDALVGPELTRVLNDAAPIYRRHWWPTHDAMNRLWIAALEPILARLGPRLAKQLAAAYGAPWYPDPIRVDVTAYAEPRILAYTTGTAEGHVVVASTDPCDQGYAALETLFHEASHTIVDVDVGPVGTGIIAAAKAQHVQAPSELWHALMFYTQGELLRRDLAELGVGYEPDTGVCNVYRGDWALYRDAAALYWRPHLFGVVPIDTALANMVRALTEAKRAGTEIR